MSSSQDLVPVDLKLTFINKESQNAKDEKIEFTTEVTAPRSVIEDPCMMGYFGSHCLSQAMNVNGIMHPWAAQTQLKCQHCFRNGQLLQKLFGSHYKIQNGRVQAWLEVYPYCFNSEPCKAGVMQLVLERANSGGGPRVLVSGVSCSLCYAQQEPSESFKRCGRCKKAVYCSRRCQKIHWVMHKEKCKPAT